MKPKSIIFLEKKLNINFEDWGKNTHFHAMVRLRFSNQVAGYCIDGQGEVTGMRIRRSNLSDISFLQNFRYLKTLSLESNRLKDIKILQECKYLTHLDLGDNEISDFSPLKYLKELSYLCLDRNPISNFVLENVFQLRHLQLENCQIENLSLIGLGNLEILQMTGNKFKNIFIKNLQSLRKLNLANNSINHIQLYGLPNLTYLNLRSNEITNTQFLENLSGIIELDIDLNPILDYTGLQNLPILETLTIKNEISYNYIRNSTYLKQIYLSGTLQNTKLLDFFYDKNLFPNLITIGCKTDIIINLEKKFGAVLRTTFPGGVENWIDNERYLINDKGEVTAFWLRRFEVNDISFLTQFPKLEILDMRINSINDISLLKGLSELRELHLYRNAITEIPLDFFESLPKLEYINLCRNPITNIPEEIFNKDENVLNELKIYLNSLQGEREYLHQAKMILVGNGEVGKSSIRIKLLDKTAPLPKKENRTQGLDIEQYRIKDLSSTITNLSENINFDLAIWDFGGQGRYREVQQLFCSRKALYLFVTSIDDCPDKEDYIGFEYWLSMAKAYGYDKKENWQSPIIHVINKCDLGKRTVNETALISVFGNIHEFVKISCETLENFDNLERFIKTALPKISKDIFNNQFSKKWFAVKTHLDKKRINNHITLQEYEDICTSEGLNKGEGDLWLDYLDRIGSIIYFRDNLKLNNFIVLNPLWVKDCIYKILDSDLVQNGVLETNFLSYIWATYNKYEQENLLDIMLAYKFCYPQKNNFGNTFYIIPALLPEVKPFIPNHVCQYKFNLKFDYDPFIPAGTVNKLMVELNEYIYQNCKWKSGFIIHLINNDRMSFAEIIEDWEKKTVFVKLGGDNLHDLYNLIRKTLSELLEDLKKIKFLDTLEMEAKVLVDGEYELPKTIVKFGRQEDFYFLFGNKENFNKTELNNQMRTLKIFLASSSELKEDRDALRLFISLENDRLNEKGANIYLQLVQWEYFLDTVSDTSSQTEYNKALKECDIVLSLFFSKAGKYTQEEFESAYQNFKDTGKPKIYAYFKDAPINTGSITDDVISLLNFRKRLQEIGHFPTSYTDIENLKVQFKRQLDKLIDLL